MAKSNYANPYTLRVDNSEGISRYYVSFSDGQNISRKTEVSKPIYLAFEQSIRHERNLRRWDERHIEHSELSDEALYSRALNLPRGIEDAMIASEQNEKLRKAINELPEIQQRRFVLYHEFGLTYEQIAEMEGCKKQSVYETICRAKKKLRPK